MSEGLDLKTASDQSMAGVASLDSPLLQQTKSEIRSIAAEIARLAHSEISQAQFFDGFLSRIVTAMGAVGAGIWQTTGPRKADERDKYTLLAHHQLPRELFVAPKNSKTDRSTTENATTSLDELATTASPVHQRILECVTTEAKPILVPPSTVSLTAERPTNPLTDALILVPVLVLDEVALVVEVVQRATGGPAAQRGYLRFVAQMADLLADFVHRDRLRTHVQQASQSAELQSCLISVAACGDIARRRQLAIDSLVQLLNAEHGILVQKSDTSRTGKYKTLSIANTGRFDPRSELVLATEAFVGKVVEDMPRQTYLQFLATNRRTQSELESLPDEAREDFPRRRSPDRLKTPPELQRHVDELCESLGVRRLTLACLGTNANLFGLFSFANLRLQDSPSVNSIDVAKTLDTRILEAIGCQLEWQPGHELSTVALAKQLLFSPWRSLRADTRKWLTRGGIACGFAAVACLPVPNRVNAIATLHPAAQTNYFANSTATVREILVHDGDSVTVGQPLLELENPLLDSQILRLRARETQLQEQLAATRSEIGKSDSTALQRTELEFKQHNLENEIAEVAAELGLREAEHENLTVRAREDGLVGSWNLENRLLHRPVAIDDLLISTYRPDASWYFELAIPEDCIGQVQRALDLNSGATEVRFTLNSNPDVTLSCILNDLGEHSVSPSPVGSLYPERTARSVLTHVEIQPQSLPMRKSGALAHATIDCGSVSLAWLFLRDAYLHISSRIRMLW